MFLKLRLSAPVLFHTMLYAPGSFSILNKSIYIAFPGGSDGKESVCNAGDLGSIPGSGRSPGGGNGNPLQCAGLENFMDSGAWQATAHRVAKSWTRLSNSHTRIHTHTHTHTHVYLFGISVGLGQGLLLVLVTNILLQE